MLTQFVVLHTGLQAAENGVTLVAEPRRIGFDQPSECEGMPDGKLFLTKISK